MKAALRAYLEHGFAQLFTGHTPQWLDEAAELGVAHGDLILSDLQTKDPGFAPSDESRLAHRLETDGATAGVVVYRIAHALYRRESRHAALPYLAEFMRARTGMEIYYSAEIGPRFRVMHGVGLVLGPRHRIGSDFTVYQCVTLGQRRNWCSDEFLTIGDRCTFFAGAAALGALRIADDVKLAAHAVLLSDAATPGTYAGAPAARVR